MPPKAENRALPLSTMPSRTAPGLDSERTALPPITTGAPTCTLIAYESQQGIKRDLALLTAYLSALGVQIRTKITPPHVPTFVDEIATSRKAQELRLHRTPLWAAKALQLTARARTPRRHEIKVFLERLPLPDLLDSSYKIFIPNPEWLIPEDEWKLALLDSIACKTRSATDTFSRRNLPAYYLGFTSEDHYSPDSKPDRRKYLHIASGGTQKGTAEILDAWHRHPEWPNLTVLAGKSPLAPGIEIDTHNINIIRRWVSDSELRSLMQHCGVHVCCSNAEGFGHTIMEGMSCGALVITTDFPPMNELIDESRGILVRTRSSVEMRSGRFARLEREDLEKAINLSIEMPEVAYRAKCRNARAWFLQERMSFEGRLTGLFHSILATRTRPAPIER
jgi:glycosyltransferase involved in cell wall biosynthesis